MLMLQIHTHIYSTPDTAVCVYIHMMMSSCVHLVVVLLLDMLQCTPFFCNSFIIISWVINMPFINIPWTCCSFFLYSIFSMRSTTAWLTWAFGWYTLCFLDLSCFFFLANRCCYMLTFFGQCLPVWSAASFNKWFVLGFIAHQSWKQFTHK